MTQTISYTIEVPLGPGATLDFVIEVPFDPNSHGITANCRLTDDATGANVSLHELHEELVAHLAHTWGFEPYDNPSLRHARYGLASGMAPAFWREMYGSRLEHLVECDRIEGVHE